MRVARIDRVETVPAPLLDVPLLVVHEDAVAGVPYDLVLRRAVLDDVDLVCVRKPLRKPLALRLPDIRIEFLVAAVHRQPRHDADAVAAALEVDDERVQLRHVDARLGVAVRGGVVGADARKPVRDVVEVGNGAVHVEVDGAGSVGVAVSIAGISRMLADGLLAGAVDGRLVRLDVDAMVNLNGSHLVHVSSLSR